MSMMNKIKSMLKGHESKAAKGIDMAGDLVDRKTHGKYRRHVDKAQSKLKQELGKPGGHGQPGQHGQQGNQPGQGPQPGQGQGPYGDQGRPPQR